MAKVIHNDLTVANVSSWSYWTAMDIPHWNHKNRFLLICLEPQGVEWGDITKEGSYRATPTLWVLGNYSRFVRPGYQRIACTLNESRSFFGNAWRSADGKEIIAVYANLSDKAVRLGETREGWQPTAITTYTTSAGKQLQAASVAVDAQVTLDAQSVTTVVYKL